jgi:Flavin containing amine oxidoreductase
MALGPALRMKLTHIAKALKDFASEQGWGPGEYKILFRVLKTWGKISVYFVVKDFGGLSEREMWERVWDHLKKSLASEGDAGYSVGLSVHDWEQVNQGGTYSIPKSYIDEEELLPSASVTK